MKLITPKTGQDIFDLLQENQELVRKESEQFQKWISMFVPGTKYGKITDDGVIYGEVLDPLKDADEDEVEYLKEVYEGSPEIRFVKAHSIYCPEGELGDEWPQSVQFILTDEDFELARKLKWPNRKISSLNPSSIKNVDNYMEGK